VDFANKPLRPKGVSLSTNVLLTLWNVMRNERRPRQADQVKGRIKDVAKCGGRKSWTLIQLEKSLETHPHIAMKMMEHLPNKSLKQIRDEHREPTFKALVKQHKVTKGHSATSELHDIICPSSDSETESCLVPTRRYISETEDEVTSDQGQMSRQLSPSPPRTGQTSLAHRHIPESRQLPGLERLVGDGLPPSRTDVDDQEPQVTRMPLIESGATDDLGSTSSGKIQTYWPGISVKEYHGWRMMIQVPYNRRI
jgi:hypothetical protein